MNRPIRETWKYLRQEDTEVPCTARKKELPAMGTATTVVLIIVAALLIAVGDVVGSKMRSRLASLEAQWSNNANPIAYIIEQLSTGYRRVGITEVVCLDKAHAAHIRIWMLTHTSGVFTIDVIVFKSNNVVVIVTSADGVERWVPVTFELLGFTFDESTNRQLRQAVLDIVTHTDGM